MGGPDGYAPTYAPQPAPIDFNNLDQPPAGNPQPADYMGGMPPGGGPGGQVPAQVVMQPPGIP